MRRDSKKMRGERPFLLISLRQGDGVEDLMQWVNSQLVSLPKIS
jgi:urease accessory protein